MKKINWKTTPYLVCILCLLVACSADSSSATNGSATGNGVAVKQPNTNSGHSNSQGIMPPAKDQGIGELKRRLTFLEDYVACNQLQDRARRAWTNHRPTSPPCRSRGRKCLNTGLKVKTFRNYRYRVQKVSDALAKDAASLSTALDKLGDAPVSPIETYNYRPGQSRAAYLQARIDAEKLTAAFSKGCFKTLYPDQDM